MSDNSNVARPYAKAVFELARDAGDFSGWSDQLAFLSMLSKDAGMIEAVQNPAVSKQQVIDLILDLGKDQLSSEGQNLVKLLIKNDRLAATADITQQFLVLRDEAEQVIEAQLITAAKVNKTQMKSIETALSKRLGKKVKLEAMVDESLIGGAIVRAGDWVVDGSVKTQLQELVGAVSA